MPTMNVNRAEAGKDLDPVIEAVTTYFQTEKLKQQNNGTGNGLPDNKGSSRPGVAARIVESEGEIGSALTGKRSALREESYAKRINGSSRSSRST